MDKPKTFAGRVIQKYGKTTTNDYAQPEKFFADVMDFYRLLDGIPFSAVEELEKYDGNRGIMVAVMKRMYQIFDAAKIDLVEEIKKEKEQDPFNGIEEDLEIKKRAAMKISGEEV